MPIWIRRTKMYKIELYEGKDGPRFRILAGNGNIIAHSEAYANKGSRTRTVNTLIEKHGFVLYESRLQKKFKNAKVIKPKKPFDFTPINKEIPIT